MKLAILMYHSIDDSGSPVSVSPRMLGLHLTALRAARYTVLPLGEALRHLRDRRDPAANERLASLTFDDGYASVHEVALPMLRRHGWRATVFPVSSYVGAENRWPGQPRFVPPARLLRWEQLEELAQAGWDVGAHSRSHPDLTTLAAPELEDEVLGAKHDLEARLCRPIDLFAYPYGLHDKRVRGMVRRHYQAACSTSMGWASPVSDDSCLERIEAWYFAHLGAHRLLGSPLMRPYMSLCGVARRRHGGQR